MTTAPVLDLSSASNVYYTFPKGFAEIIYESTRNAMPPLTVNQYPNHLASNMFHNIAHVLVKTLFQNMYPINGNTHISFLPACDHKDRFVERQPRTTAQSTKHKVDYGRLGQVLCCLPSLAAFKEEEWDGVISFLGDGWSNPSHGARGGFCLDGVIPQRWNLSMGCLPAGKHFERPCGKVLHQSCLLRRYAAVCRDFVLSLAAGVRRQMTMHGGGCEWVVVVGISCTRPFSACWSACSLTRGSATASQQFSSHYDST
ncbi:hypothetical protein EJB05_09170, partial [Eragrostis curvula]